MGSVYIALIPVFQDTVVRSLFLYVYTVLVPVFHDTVTVVIVFPYPLDTPGGKLPYFPPV